MAVVLFRWTFAGRAEALDNEAKRELEKENLSEVRVKATVAHNMIKKAWALI